MTAGRCFFLIHIFLLFTLSLTTISVEDAEAQWVITHTFSSQVRSVYFLDQIGAPFKWGAAASTGFAGLSNGQIWRTTDNGTTWTAATTPGGFPLSTYITDFTFKSATQGWCSVRGVFNSTGGIWVTSDGGLNWSSIGFSGNMVSIGYCAASGELVSTNWSGGAVQSSDLGLTWNAFASVNQDGVTFSGMYGVISTLNAPGFLYSTNGGVTWSSPSPNLSTECWSPHAITGTSIFFAVAEKSRQLFRSTNGGASWSNPYTFPINEVPRGTITGALDNLFVQTSNGFYNSTDQGNTWYPICGPVNDLDTRFYSKGKEIFAGDNLNNLWYTSDGTFADSYAIGLGRAAFSFTGERCRTYDSTLHISFTSSCVNAVLTNVQILRGLPNFSIGAQTLPRAILGPDGIPILYAPSNSGNDSGALLLEFNIAGKIVDTIISLYGTGSSPTSYHLAGDVAMQLDFACSSNDSVVILKNSSCDTLIITGASIDDTSHFNFLPDAAHLNGAVFPMTLPPGDSTSITVLTFSQHSGQFSSALYIHAIAASTNIPVEDTIPLKLIVYQETGAEFTAMAVSLLDRCVSLDTTFSIYNDQCDSMVLLQARLRDGLAVPFKGGANGGDTTYFTMAPLPLPVTIASNSELTFPIHFNPGAKGDYTGDLYLEYIYDGKTVDTVIMVKMRVLYDIPVRAVLSAAALDMGSVAVPCDDATNGLTLTNTLCQSLTISKIAWELPDSEYWASPADSVVLPVILKTDSSLTFRIHFKPGSTNRTVNRLHITLILDGESHDTVITVSGRGISVYTDTILPSALQFDSLLPCSSQLLEADIINRSCDSVIATSLDIPSNTGFSSSTALPAVIKSGDTLHLEFLFQPKQTGDVKGSAIITLHNPADGKDYLRTIDLSGDGKPAQQTMAIFPSSISLHDLPSCSPTDTSIELFNRSLCGDIIISSIGETGFPGIVIDSNIAFPVILHPGDSVRVAFRIMPQPDSTALSWIVIAGANIDTTIAIRYSASRESYRINLGLEDSIFTARPCQMSTKHYWIANTGCETVPVDSVWFAESGGSSQFQLIGLPSLPASISPGDSLLFTVQFDPSGIGDSTAMLQASAKQANFLRSVTLRGTSIGVIPSAGITLETGSPTQPLALSAKSGASATIKIFTSTAIGDSCGLTDISFTLHYNSDLLTKQNVIGIGGWTVMSATEQPNGSLDVRLLRRASAAIALGSEIAECALYVTLGDSARCNITLGNVRFNSDDPNYEQCSLKPVASFDTISFALLDSCGSPLIRERMSGELALTVLSIEPNPVSASEGAKHAMLTFSLHSKGIVNVRMVDLLGRKCMDVSQLFEAGIHSIPLTLTGQAEGTYFVSVELADPVAGGAFRVVRKIILMAH
jgi:hypothetical protein